eukprot:Rmarinus@m.26782
MREFALVLVEPVKGAPPEFYLQWGEQCEVRIGRQNFENFESRAHRLSRKHITLTCKSGPLGEREIWAKDLSLNGVFVDGKKLGRHQERKLQHGEVLELFNPSLMPKAPKYKFVDLFLQKECEGSNKSDGRRTDEKLFMQPTYLFDSAAGDRALASSDRRGTAVDISKGTYLDHTVSATNLPSTVASSLESNGDATVAKTHLVKVDVGDKAESEIRVKPVERIPPPEVISIDLTSPPPLSASLSPCSRSLDSEASPTSRPARLSPSSNKTAGPHPCLQRCDAPEDGGSDSCKFRRVGDDCRSRGSRSLSPSRGSRAGIERDSCGSRSFSPSRSRDCRSRSRSGSPSNGREYPHTDRSRSYENRSRNNSSLSNDNARPLGSRRKLSPRHQLQDRVRVMKASDSLNDRTSRREYGSHYIRECSEREIHRSDRTEPYRGGERTDANGWDLTGVCPPNSERLEQTGKCSTKNADTLENEVLTQKTIRKRKRRHERNQRKRARKEMRKLTMLHRATGNDQCISDVSSDGEWPGVDDSVAHASSPSASPPANSPTFPEPAPAASASVLSNTDPHTVDATSTGSMSVRVRRSEEDNTLLPGEGAVGVSVTLADDSLGDGDGVDVTGDQRDQSSSGASLVCKGDSVPSSRDMDDNLQPASSIQSSPPLRGRWGENSTNWTAPVSPPRSVDRDDVASQSPEAHEGKLEVAADGPNLQKQSLGLIRVSCSRTSLRYRLVSLESRRSLQMDLPNASIVSLELQLLY